MPYELVTLNEVPWEITKAISDKVFYQFGVYFKNRVPIVKDFPECFTEISEEYYEKAMATNYIMQKRS